MLPKRCQYCRHLFLPKASGLGAALCRFCSSRCEKVCEKIRLCRQEQPEISWAVLTTRLGIPQVFIHQLLLCNMVSLPTPPAAAVESESTTVHCYSCQRALKPLEKTLCTLCRLLVDRQKQRQGHIAGKGL